MTDQELPDEEVIRTAIRIATSSWAQLQVDSETMSEVEVLMKYIRLCPYLPPDILTAAMEGLERYNDATVSNRKKQEYSQQPAVVAIESLSTTTANHDVKSNRRGLPVIAFFIWTIFLDLPLMVLLVSFLSICWVHRVHDLYLKPQMDFMVWNSQRAEKEITYYRRPCDGNDMTTTNPDDLLLSDDATVEDAYHHQLLHGFTIFPRILGDEAVNTLRDFVVSRNRNLTVDDSLYVIENENRFSFGLGTEELSVVRALKELANNQLLVQVMERVLGPNPALIELTAITATYGAVPQHWHSDTIPTASALQYGRTFSPSYSLFIPLQNTTTQMGATSVCPGTYQCPAGEIEVFCEDLGFQIVDSEGYWRAGDALLMNMDGYHRGAGHSDPDGLDRVLFILTFCPKPLPRAESRQMSHGITFSLRWDLWGHTLRDLAYADTAMRRPWSILRSLGLYKSRGAAWGLDYITSTSMRVANHDNGFRQDELKKFIERGGITWIPEFLHGVVGDSETWYHYLWKTFLKCETFVFVLYLCAIGSYTFFGLMIIVMSEINDGKIVVSHVIPRVGVALRRLLLLHLTFYGCLKAANVYVDRTGWAKDIIAGRLFSNPFAGEEDYEEKSVRLYSNFYLRDERLLKELKSTFPHRNDVLIENRYSSGHFGLYNDFVSSHPGNRIFNELVACLAEAYKDFSEMFRDATARFIVSTIQIKQGRFLYQDWEPSWRLLSDNDAVEYTKYQLKIATNPIMKKIASEINFLVSDCKFGLRRRTVLLHKHSILFLKSLLRTVTRITDLNKMNPVVQDAGLPQAAFRRSFALSLYASKSKFVKRPVKLPVGCNPGPPNPNAWLREGDMVDALLQFGDTTSRWFPATILLVTSSGSFHVQFADGDTTIVELTSLRPFVSYLGDATLEVLCGGIWYPGVVVAEHGSRIYDVSVLALNATLENVGPSIFRRRLAQSPS
jgi:hypothetical protein